jgi:hypothetical protein
VVPDVSTAEQGILPALPQSWRVVALLVPTGHSRREIGYLLRRPVGGAPTFWTRMALALASGNPKTSRGR